MCVPGSKCQIAGVLAYRMGQENVMGRHSARPQTTCGSEMDHLAKGENTEHITYSTCKVCRPKSFGLYLGYS